MLDITQIQFLFLLSGIALGMALGAMLFVIRLWRILLGVRAMLAMPPKPITPEYIAELRNKMHQYLADTPKHEAYKTKLRELGAL